MKFNFTFQNQMKKNTLDNKNNSNSFSVKLKYPEIIINNNNLFNLKKNIKIYPKKSLSE